MNQFDELGEYNKIDNYIERLQFFKKYPFLIRKQMINHGKIKVYSDGEIIFNQGEIQSHFYVLLRGSIKVMLRKADFGNIPIIINSIYDGKEFGDTNHYEVSENLSQEMVNHLNK